MFFMLHGVQVSFPKYRFPKGKNTKVHLHCHLSHSFERFMPTEQSFIISPISSNSYHLMNDIYIFSD